MDEKEYHRKRRMFFVINDKLVLPEIGSDKSHFEWLESNNYSTDKAKKIIENNLRGVINPDGSIRFFVGKDRTINDCIEEKFFEILPELVKIFNLKSEIIIGGGVKKGKAGEVWPAIKEYGQVKDYIKK
ncbi:MAG: hypothetical protein KIH89_001985 [Candidatus Shapirobacteria bacterium]|nr:hypothetical protein [Candidatus Shapirobacteria bacterium]